MTGELHRDYGTFSALIDAMTAARTLELRDLTISTTAHRVDGVTQVTYHLDAQPLHPLRRTGAAS